MAELSRTIKMTLLLQPLELYNTVFLSMCVKEMKDLHRPVNYLPPWVLTVGASSIDREFQSSQRW